MNYDYDVKIVCPDDYSRNTFKKSQLNGRMKHSNLQSKYIFETFVRGKSNELAFAAAVAVAESPGFTKYNPLFLYGGVGLGKTHLMHSIGNYALEQKDDVKILYVSSETFTIEFINSIKQSKNQEFRDKYREVDVLLIDDIQFLSERAESTQEELFHTFNALYNANKQIVITSDRPPKELKTLEERLRSRFGCGLIIDVTQPDFETRIAILEKKCEIDSIYVPDDVINFIAKNVVSNIRELEGALNKVAAYAKLSSNMKISMDLAKQALKDIINNDGKKDIDTIYIQKMVAEYYNLTYDELKSKKRTQRIAYPRQVAMYLSRKILDLSLPQLGVIFGRDHSTISHGCDKITYEMENDQKARESIIELENKIRAQ
jgi:chromosomal replication initiator protein